jgi:DNA helicase II / ATP-dependent DNA helicase PcrA
VETKEFELEKQNLKHTIEQIKNRQYHVRETLKTKKEKITTHANEPGDMVTYRLGEHEQKLLENALEEPYFGRFDTYCDEEGKETFYIGKQGIVDLDEDIIVVDWRRPLASVYYNFMPGMARQVYEANNQKIEVDVLQKREFTIKDQRLIKFIQQTGDFNSDKVSFSDEGEELTVTDDFLREILSNNETTGYLKEIIATIQQEQDQAIRQPIDRSVIIQGAAGSGKSSVALHRLSYLLYNNKHINPSDVLILGPSKLFISSFKGLLPELNLEGIQQSTYQELVLRYLQDYLKEKDVDLSLKLYFEDTMFFSQGNADERKRIAFKGSQAFVEVIETFINELEMHYDQRMQPIMLFEERLHKEKLLEMYNGYAYLPFFKRVERFIEHVERHYLDLLNQKVKELEKQYDFITQTYLQDAGLSNDQYENLAKQMKQILEYKKAKNQQQYKETIIGWKNKMKLTDPVALYKQLLSYDMLKAYEHEVGEEIPFLFKESSMDRLTYFDLPPIFYIYLSLFGVEKKLAHLVVDEGQDFSFMHYAGIRKLTKEMTILGDKEQSIFMEYGTTDWESLIIELFNFSNDTILELNTSYRSTKEIIEAANIVLSNQFGNTYQPITAVNRSGPALSFSIVESGKDLMDQMIAVLEEWKKQHKRIAIIHKDEEKSLKIAEYIKKVYQHHAVYISPNEEVQTGSLSVLSSYNCKGMEFDAVILVNVNEETFPKDDLHARLLYVLLTRAQQEVKVFYQDKPSELLNGLVEVKDKSVAMFDDIL